MGDDARRDNSQLGDDQFTGERHAAGGRSTTRHQRPHVRHDHGRDDDGEHDVEPRTATVLLSAARNSSEHEQGWLRDTELLETTFQNGPCHKCAVVTARVRFSLS